MLLFSKNHECWHTFEAYYIADFNMVTKYFHFKFINLGTDEFSNGENLEYIDYSFVQVYGVSKIILNGQVLYEDIYNNGQFSTIHIGGVDLNTNEGYNEFEIKCISVSLLIPSTANIRKDAWIPIDTPNISRNMVPEEVLHFLNLPIV